MNRCPHEVFLPEGQTKSWGCQGCYPEGHDEATEAPVLMERSPLRARENSLLPTCPDCGKTTTRDSICIQCGKLVQGSIGGLRLRANRREPGECPGCGERTHFETSDPKKWQCSACDTIYDAPRGKRK